MCIRMCVQIGVVQSVIMNNKSNAEKKTTREAKHNEKENGRILIFW